MRRRETAGWRNDIFRSDSSVTLSIIKVVEVRHLYRISILVGIDVKTVGNLIVQTRQVVFVLTDVFAATKCRQSHLTLFHLTTAALFTRVSNTLGHWRLFHILRYLSQS